MSDCFRGAPASAGRGAFCYHVCVFDSTDLYGGRHVPVCRDPVHSRGISARLFYRPDQTRMFYSQFTGKLAETLMVCKIHTLTFEFRGNNNQTPKKLNKTKKAEKMAALLWRNLLSPLCHVLCCFDGWYIIWWRVFTSLLSQTQRQVKCLTYV